MIQNHRKVHLALTLTTSFYRIINGALKKPLYKCTSKAHCLMLHGIVQFVMPSWSLLLVALVVKVETEYYLQVTSGQSIGHTKSVSNNAIVSMFFFKDLISSWNHLVFLCCCELMLTSISISGNMYDHL